MNRMRLCFLASFSSMFLGLAPGAAAHQVARGTVVVRVHTETGVVEQAEVSAGDISSVTNEHGEAVLELPVGEVELKIQRFGFKPAAVKATVRPGATTRIEVEVEAEAVVKEEVVVTATRTGKRIQDEPLRVEVLGHEELEEKALMTPGNIAMLLNETSGLRVQVTSPSLGAANVRVQGLRGRYTQLLADGLPLYGGQTGAIGLLQIPPMDLRQVEVIKGVASALYGSSALGGVINLVSRQPEKREREMLVNRTSRGGTDATLWLAAPLGARWGYTLLGGGHFQQETDINRDGWADLAGYGRAVVRPRLFWDNHTGRSLFVTIGGMTEEREGGTLNGATVPDGSSFPESLSTRRLDAGVTARLLVGGSRLLTIRASAMDQRRRHQFGDVRERDRNQTWFGEVALNGTRDAHTWVIGGALQSDLYRSQDVPRFNYTYTVPSLFVQDDYVPISWLSVSASARLDAHSEFGAFVNPRVSGLLRLPEGWIARLSAGTGYFAPTPFTEETEAVGLSRLRPLRGVDAEHARSISLDVGRGFGPIELNATLFGSLIDRALTLRESRARDGGLEIVNAPSPTRTLGSELLARFHRRDFRLTTTYTFVRSTEPDRETGIRQDVPLTPAHTGGLIVSWEDEARGRVGVEFFYTGRQRLDENPYRQRSEPYTYFGLLAERHIGRIRLFVNAENLTNVRQTRYDPLLRRERGFDGRWTVDEWASLEGRIVNGGFRVRF